MPLLRFFQLSNCFGDTDNFQKKCGHNLGLKRMLKKKYTQYDVPKQSFLKLVKLGRFDDINSILDHENAEQQLLDVDRWLDASIVKYYECTNGTSNRCCTLVQNGKQAFQANPTVLHVLVHHRPPLSTVEALIETLCVTGRREVISQMRQNKSKQINIEQKQRSSNQPHPTVGMVHPELAIDMKGQTPLHVAARRGCHATVVSRLMNTDGEHSTTDTVTSSEGRPYALPVRMKDRMGRYPLHWACSMDAAPNSIQSPPASAESSGRNFLNNSAGGGTTPVSQNNFHENMVAVVDLLIQAYPNAVVEEDVNQKTPLDLAYDNRLDKRILWSLFKVAGEITSRGMYGDDKHDTVFGATSMCRSRRGNCSRRHSTSFSTMTDDLSSIYSVPRQIRGEYDYDEESSQTSEADSGVSSIGEGGVSVYRPENVKHENRNFLTV